MPRFFITRTVGEMSEEGIQAAVTRGVEALDHLQDVRWVRSYYSAEEGKIYCEYEAPSAEAIYEHARMAELPLDRYTVERNLEPSMFR